MIKVFNGAWRGIGRNEQRLHLNIEFGFREVLHHFKGAKLHIFMALCLHSDPDGFSFPSYTTLQSETGYSREAISKALAELCDMQIDGHPVLMRWRDINDDGNAVGSNRYRVFPTESEIASLAKTNEGQSENRTSQKIELPASQEIELGGSQKSRLEEDPVFKNNQSEVEQSDWISRPEPIEAERLFEQIIGRTVVKFESDELRQLSQQHPASHFKAAFEVIAQRIKAGQNIKYPVEYAKPILLQALSVGLAAFEQPTQPSSPAVAAFTEYWGKQPNSEQARLITDTVTNVDKWKEAMKGWAARNYRWDNVPGQLDFYAKGGNPAAGKDKPNATSRKKVPTEGWHAGLIKEWQPTPEQDAEFEQWLASLNDQPDRPAVRPLRQRIGQSAAD